IIWGGGGGGKKKTILKKYCSVRKQVTESSSSFGKGLMNSGVAEETTLGGATMFVLNVDEYEKI
ncbi:MAG: hypothetical protein RRY76_03845, partial [Clostridia bacterium]